VRLVPFYGYLDNTLKIFNELSVFFFLVLMQGLKAEFNHVEHEEDYIRKDCAFQKLMGIVLIVVLLFQVAVNLVIKVVTKVRDVIKKRREKRASKIMAE